MTHHPNDPSDRCSENSPQDTVQLQPKDATPSKHEKAKVKKTTKFPWNPIRQPQTSGFSLVFNKSYPRPSDKYLLIQMIKESKAMMHEFGGGWKLGWVFPFLPKNFVHNLGYFVFIIVCMKQSIYLIKYHYLSQKIPKTRYSYWNNIFFLELALFLDKSNPIII